jgi:hypothetical protein
MRNYIGGFVKYTVTYKPGARQRPLNKQPYDKPSVYSFTNSLWFWYLSLLIHKLFANLSIPVSDLYFSDVMNGGNIEESW